MKIKDLQKILGKDWQFQIVEGEIKIAHPTITGAYRLKEFIDMIRKAKKPEDLPAALSKLIYGKTFEDLKKQVEEHEKKEKMQTIALIIAGSIGLIGTAVLIKKMFRR